MPNARQPTPNLPPGYPSGYEPFIVLPGGRQVEVRPILPSDAPELAEAIRTADAETLRARFLGGPPQLSDAVLGDLTCVDYVTRFALVAHSQGHGIAVARYGMLPVSEDELLVADIAVAVAPKWRRVGLATALVGLLARRAQECGITDFTALFLASNRPVTELAHEGHARVVIAEGIAQLHARLSQLDQGWPRDDEPEERHQ
jgi:GNAT superfamily N-acetyltransferase